MQETIFITGADKGLGFSLVNRFLERDFHVFAGSLGSGEALKNLATEVPGRLEIVPQNVADSGSIRASAEAVAARTDHLDILINNAGINSEDTKRSSIREVNLGSGDLEAIMSVNAFGPLRVTQAFLPLLEKGARKRIVNISSEAGSIADCGREGWYAYCMSKAALNMQSMILQRSLKPQGFKVLAVHPGWVITTMGGPEGQITPDNSAADIAELATRAWSLDDPVYMDHTGHPLNW